MARGGEIWQTDGKKEKESQTMNRIQANIRVLSDDEIVRIHNTSMRILSEIGLHVPNEIVCGMAQKLGAKVDGETVRIPAEALDPILALARAGDHAFAASGQTVRKISGNVSTQIFVFDEQTGTRRQGTMQDVRDGIALIEGLPNIARSNAVVVPSDVPMPDLLSFREIYKHARKDGGTYILSDRSAPYILQMAQVMGRTVSYLLDTVSPLGFTRESLEIALQFAAAGMPLDMTPLVMAGSTAPVTLAGALAQQNAEVLGSPNQALFGIATAQMAAFYGLTSGSNSGLTDAPYPDFQAGFEKSFSAVCSVLAGSDAIGGQGIVGADQGFSFAQLVLDDAWLDAFNYTLQGFTVDEDTLGFETIEEVGIGGNFLSEWHTVEYMRASWWKHDLFPRQTFQDGEPIQTARQRAQERAQAIIEENRTDEPVIDGAQCAMLDKIVQDALDHLDA
ncbi:trimethylamine methyltransferase family protein [Butyricicoccus pullicaecorum]|nr:trimethylamine methyltransferase family protein [Butyricicoccus pullicaecorum]